MTDIQRQPRDIFDAAAAQIILAQLPDRIQQAILKRSAEINYPVEALLEMAIAGYLDNEAIGFADCKPDRGQ
jgi:hypothetical protein